MVGGVLDYPKIKPPGPANWGMKNTMPNFGEHLNFGNVETAIMAIWLKLAIMAWHNMDINMVIMSVSAKNRQNVDSLWKQIGKNRIG